MNESNSLSTGTKAVLIILAIVVVCLIIAFQFTLVFAIIKYFNPGYWFVPALFLLNMAAVLIILRCLVFKKLLFPLERGFVLNYTL